MSEVRSFQRLGLTVKAHYAIPADVLCLVARFLRLLGDRRARF